MSVTNTASVMKKTEFATVLIVCLLMAKPVLALQPVMAFSATAVQTVPGRAAYRASMYVSKRFVRTDSLLNNVAVIEIVDLKKQIRSLLVAKDKIYLQQKFNKPLTVAADASDNKSPCQGMANTTCRKLANEKINDRQTEKWEFVVNRNGQRLRSLHWIDIKRRMPIREFYPDGTVTELAFRGKDRINGRKTEKWQMTMSNAGGQQLTSTQWYDPQLKITIREEIPGGFVRELRDIKIGKQATELFVIPEEYKKVKQLPSYLQVHQPMLPRVQ